jgi:tetratricopeptide (TPR) repeat protein
VFREALRFSEDRAGAHYYLGSALRRKGEYDEAISVLREAIRIRKDHPEAHAELGLALQKKGRLDEAIAAHRAAIRLKKDDPGAHNNLGGALYDANQVDEAITEFRAAIRLRKDYGEAHANLGLALKKKGRLDEAIAAFREAIRFKNDAAHISLGIALGDKGELDEAIAEFHEAIRIKKDDARAHTDLGVALVKKGRLDEAVAALREAVRRGPNLAQAHGALGRALMQQGQFAQALASTRRCLELLRPGDPLRPHVSQYLQQCERLHALEQKLAEVLAGKAQPAHVRERLALAWLCQVHKKRFAAATRFYAEAFAAKPQAAEELRHDARYNAACTAALAGCGQGKDADRLDDRERSRLRRQALEWLRADLAAWAQFLERKPDQARAAVQQALRHWQQDEDLAGVRGEALARLPEGERQSWRQLWGDVEQASRKASSNDAHATPKMPVPR